ncbi:helix-turn-helix domain-containing protein [Nonomuraea sp. NPDC050691]|uniref:helix-turn-helix domain-containing protein n=1 Tax=Nonomuraea sp. NPDC050691 TaxID=3155661 RepID=UPI0033ED1096
MNSGRRRRRGAHAAGGYLTREGLEERFAYPSSSEIRYTWIMLTPDAHDEYVAGVQGAPGWMLAITAVLDLRHRELLSACRRGADRLEVGERLLILLAALPPRTGRPGPGMRPTTRVIHRRMATAVQEALSCGRIFRRVTGRTISEYRNELRVRAVLEHIADGGARFAELATMYGFADHARLTRTVRRHLAETPSALRGRLD